MTIQKRNALAEAIKKRAFERPRMPVDYADVFEAEYANKPRYVDRGTFPASDTPNKKDVPKIGIDILDTLLQHVESVHFSVESDKSDYLIESVEQLFRLAKDQGFEIGIKRNNPFVYNGAYWQRIEWEPFRNFLQATGTLQGIPRRIIRHYSFVGQLEKQFRNDARFPLLSENKTSKINLNNGTLHFMPDGPKMKPFDKSDGLTYKVGYAYDPSATAPLFKKFFDRVLPDEQMQKLIFQYIAYVFLRHLNHEKILFLYGGGANGKSVFLNVIKGLVGKEQCCSYGLEGITKKEGQRAQLGNYLLNICTENSTRMRVDAFKKIASRESLDVRNLYKDSFILHDYATSIFAMNELPRVPEFTKAFFRRFIIIPFDVQIPEEEQEKDLADRIIASEMSGVLNLVIAGAKSLLEEGKFDIPPKIDEILEKFHRESNTVETFIEDNRLQPSTAKRTPLRDLYHSYKLQCIDNGFRPENKRTFAKRLREREPAFEVKEYGKENITVVFVERRGKRDEE